MRRPVSHSIALSTGLGRKNPVTPGDLRPEKVPWKWEPPSPTSPEVGAGLTEVGWRLGTRTFGARSETPTDRCPPGPRKPASLLAPRPFPAPPCWPHPCSLLAEPDRRPGRAEIQGPYLPGGIQHAVSRFSTAIGLPSFQNQGALCPAAWRGFGGGPLPGMARTPGLAGPGKAGLRGHLRLTTDSFIASFVYSSCVRPLSKHLSSSFVPNDESNGLPGLRSPQAGDGKTDKSKSPPGGDRPRLLEGWRWLQARGCQGAEPEPWTMRVPGPQPAARGARPRTSEGAWPSSALT